jgi:hypothetical protein
MQHSCINDATIDAIPTPLQSHLPTIVSCNGGNDGTITVDVTEGLIHILKSKPVTQQTQQVMLQVFILVLAGTTYEVTVNDAKSCDYVSGPITVDQPTALDAAVVTTELKCGPANANRSSSNCHGYRNISL